MNNNRILAEFAKMSYIFCMDYFINKLKILLVLFSLFSLSNIYFSFGFCVAYKYTQIYVMKCAFYSCVMSQLSPFILCWIPSVIRKVSILQRNQKLYSFNRLIEYLFVA